MKKLLLAVLVLIGLQTQAQQATPYFCCDSITYWTDQGQGLFVGLDTTGIIHNPDSMTVSWQVCNSDMCYVGDGINAFFGQIVTTDTIKVGYDIYIYENGVLEICSIEEWNGKKINMKEEKGFLNKIIRFDTAMIAMNYFSFALAKGTSNLVSEQSCSFGEILV